MSKKPETPDLSEEEIKKTSKYGYFMLGEGSTTITFHNARGYIIATAGFSIQEDGLMQIDWSDSGNEIFTVGDALGIPVQQLRLPIKYDATNQLLKPSYKNSFYIAGEEMFKEKIQPQGTVKVEAPIPQKKAPPKVSTEKTNPYATLITTDTETIINKLADRANENYSPKEAAQIIKLLPTEKQIQELFSNPKEYEITQDGMDAVLEAIDKEQKLGSRITLNQKHVFKQSAPHIAGLKTMQQYVLVGTEDSKERVDQDKFRSDLLKPYLKPVKEGNTADIPALKDVEMAPAIAAMLSIYDELGHDEGIVHYDSIIAKKQKIFWEHDADAFKAKAKKGQLTNKEEVRKAIVAVVKASSLGIKGEIDEANIAEFLPDNAYLDWQGLYGIVYGIEKEATVKIDNHPFGEKYLDCALIKAINDSIKQTPDNGKTTNPLPEAQKDKNVASIVNVYLKKNNLPNEPKHVDTAIALYENLGTGQAEEYEKIMQAQHQPKEQPVTDNEPETGNAKKNFSWKKTLIGMGAAGTALFIGNSKKPEAEVEQGQEEAKKQNWFQRNAPLFGKILLLFLAVDMTQSQVRGTTSLTGQAAHKVGIGNFTDMILGERAKAAQAPTQEANQRQ